MGPETHTCAERADSQCARLPPPPSWVFTKIRAGANVPTAALAGSLCFINVFEGYGQKRLGQRPLPHWWKLLSCGTPDECSQQFEPQFSKPVESARPTCVSGYNCHTRTISYRKRPDGVLAPFAPSVVSQATALSLTQPTFEARKQSGRSNQ